MPIVITLMISIALGLFVGQKIGSSHSPSPPLISLIENEKKPTLVSSDSQDSLITEEKRLPLPRLAHWLLDASPEEIALLWDHYSSRPGFDRQRTRLILSAWARHDLSSVITATKETKFDYDAWGATALIDPQTSLQWAMTSYWDTENKDFLRQVISTIATHHPGWLRANLDHFPEEWMKETALESLRVGLTTTPQEAIDFLTKHNQPIGHTLLLALGKEDPVAAFRLAAKLGNNDPFSPGSMPEKLIKSLAEEDPRLLDSILAETSSPSTRHLIEVEQFRHDIKTDPESALQHARELPNSYTRQDKIAALSRHFLESNPERAVNIFAQLLGKSRLLSTKSTHIITSESDVGIGGRTSPSQQLLKDLVSLNPENLINSTLPTVDNPDGGYRQVAKEWVEQDPDSFATWTSQQNNTEVYRQSAELLTYRLISDRKLAEAMTWAESGRDRGEGSSSQISYVYRHWHSREPEAATTWRQAATLDQSTQNRLNFIEAENQ